MLSTLHNVSDDENQILSAISDAISGVSVKGIEENGQFDFNGLRLDWTRLQVTAVPVSRPGPLLYWKYTQPVWKD